MSLEKPKKIQVLSSQVVDQIAAGEVVERPSHMIKELVENAIDAGATEIEVQYSEGGRSVKVIDNGSGINSEDLSAALARHGTSKISESEDLWNLYSYGFRGEALASIAAVSELTLTSKPRHQENAYKISATYGQVHAIQESGGQFGTQISISSLFENIPARLKFLKSPGAESAQIKNMFKALAMAHPQISFRLEEHGKLIFYFPGTTAQQRVSEVLGLKLYQGHAQRESLKAVSYFTDPHTVQKTSKNIWLFVQKRWIQDRSLVVAVLESYRSLLMHGEYPSAVVFIESDPALVDVNIHPTKSQVKFHDPSSAFRVVQASLREELEKAPWRGVNELASSSISVARSAAVSFSEVNQLEHIEPQNFSFQDSKLNATQFKKKEFNLYNAAPFDAELAKSESEERERVFEQTTHSLSLKNVDSLQAPADRSVQAYWSLLQILGQADLTYIVCQNEKGLVFVDQHAAHERVVFEKLMQAWRSGHIEVQNLLIPLILDFPPEKIEALLKEDESLKKLGVELEAFGPQSVAVKTLPAIIKETSLAKALEKMADEIFEHGGSFKMESLIIDICATMACHSVIRAGQSLSVEQMKSLLLQMDEFLLSSFCPHGRPVSVEYPFQKLEKDFGRTL